MRLCVCVCARDGCVLLVCWRLFHCVVDVGVAVERAVCVWYYNNAHDGSHLIALLLQTSYRCHYAFHAKQAP